METLDDYLRAGSTLYGEKVAVSADHEEICYRDLDERVDQFVQVLQAHGATSGLPVAIIAENTVASAVALFSVNRLEAITVPIHPQSRPDRITNLIGHSGATTIVDTRNNETVVTQCERPTPTDERLNDGDVAYIAYTSGSTGEPKGVTMSRASADFLIDSISGQICLTESDRILSTLPLSFDYGLYQLYMCVAVGASIHLGTIGTFVGEVVRLLKQNDFTVFPIVPTFAAMLRKIDRADVLQVPSIRAVTSTAADLSPEAIRFLQRKFPSADIYPMYGLTECKRVSILVPAQLEERISSVGRPLANTMIDIVDDVGESCPIGETGTLRVYGPHLMAGYWKDEKETSKSIVQDNAGRKCLQTADLFRQDQDGYLYFSARRDQVINHNGVNVSPREVQLAITQIPQVVDVFVCGYSDEISGEGIRAFIVVDADVDTNRIKARILEQSNPWQRPTDIQFCESLPLTENGKIAVNDIVKTNSS